MPLSITRPGKIVCVGLNYHDHAQEGGPELPSAPLLFAKWPNSLIGAGEPIVLARDVDDRRSAAIELDIHRDGERIFGGATSVSEMKRSFEELVAALFRELSFPAGAVLLTGTGVVPPDDVTLRDGDRVRIAVEGVGVLEHDIYQRSG